MKEYFKRLKDHPGVSVATMMTFLGGLAGASNESFAPLDGLIFGILVGGGLTWSIVLITNLRK